MREKEKTVQKLSSDARVKNQTIERQLKKIESLEGQVIAMSESLEKQEENYGVFHSRQRGLELGGKL